MASIDSAFDVEGLVEQRKELDSLMSSNPAMEKKLRGVIRKALTEVRKAMMRAAQEPSVMKTDPRKAYKAVRTTVYRRILGGNVNILRKRTAGTPGGYTPTRTLRQGQRGGNRRTRSSRTRALQGYQGADRGFILRFLNSGTEKRTIEFSHDSARANVKRGSRGGNVGKYGKTINTGNRGRIEPRNWFAQYGLREMERGAEILERYIDELIKKEMG